MAQVPRAILFQPSGLFSYLHIMSNLIIYVNLCIKRSLPPEGEVHENEQPEESAFPCSAIAVTQKRAGDLGVK